jgi:hypothetical protein
LAFRQAVWRKPDPEWAVCGLPTALYSDHGGDFTGSHMDDHSRAVPGVSLRTARGWLAAARARSAPFQFHSSNTVAVLVTVSAFVEYPANQNEGDDERGEQGWRFPAAVSR